MNRVFTSESVTEGHPDKMCDQISDAILDDILENDREARVACECVATTGLVLIMGEISSSYIPDIQLIVRNKIDSIGYNNPNYGFDCKSCAVISSINEQSSDIAMGVDNSVEFKIENKNKLDLIGAGDQGMMFGFACNETEDLMPAPIYYAHKLSKRLANIRKEKHVDWLRPDGKTQVTVEYDSDGNIISIPTIVISTQHEPEVVYEDIKQCIYEEVIKHTVPSRLLNKTKIHINPTGRFVIGGPVADAGLTGRKIIVDTYGGYASHGGGCFSGKDPTKVDRSGAYMARYVAKNIVAANLAKSCEIEVAYAIGIAKPVSILVNTRGTGIISDDKISKIVTDLFDFRPMSIIEQFNLRSPIYSELAAYGHFGRPELNLPWERLDKIGEIEYIAKN